MSTITTEETGVLPIPSDHQQLLTHNYHILLAVCADKCMFLLQNCPIISLVFNKARSGDRQDISVLSPDS